METESVPIPGCTDGLTNIQAILASGQDKAIPEQSTATAPSSQYGFTRGADYYGRGNK